MNKKGFTLVELLAVIVILAIILVIAVPKVMDTIDSARNASLESSAKMVAAQAENQYTVAQTLGTNFDTTDGDCTNAKWAGLNKTDYASCTYNIDSNGKATVTIVGASKFDGKYVCNGTRSSARVTEEECLSVDLNTAVGKITLLANDATKATANGLVHPIIEKEDGTTIDTGIRYSGSTSEVKNKIWFNCKDEVNGKKYGEEGYEYNSTNCELWRIVGIFDVKTNKTDSKTSQRIRIVKDGFIDTDVEWDTTADNITYINQWGETKLVDNETPYAGATLMQYLRDTYYPTLSTEAKAQIEKAEWNTGAADYGGGNMLREVVYEEERSNKTGEGTSLIYTYTWEGIVGLIYTSDFGYASKTCSNVLDASCGVSNWLTKDSHYWTLTPYSDSWNYAWIVTSSGQISHNGICVTSKVRPSVYLKSNVEIISGDGYEQPYVIKKMSN